MNRKIDNQTKLKKGFFFVITSSVLIHSFITTGFSGSILGFLFFRKSIKAKRSSLISKVISGPLFVWFLRSKSKASFQFRRSKPVPSLTSLPWTHPLLSQLPHQTLSSSPSHFYPVLPLSLSLCLSRSSSPLNWCGFSLFSFSLFYKKPIQTHNRHAWFTRQLCILRPTCIGCGHGSPCSCNREHNWL